jgi:hypothetical protein
MATSTCGACLRPSRARVLPPRSQLVLNVSHGRRPHDRSALQWEGCQHRKHRTLPFARKWCFPSKKAQNFEKLPTLLSHALLGVRTPPLVFRDPRFMENSMHTTAGFEPTGGRRNLKIVIRQCQCIGLCLIDKVTSEHFV